MYTLVYSEKGEQKTFPIVRSEITIGRARENDLTLSDISISRRHCRIRVGPEGGRISDMNTLNGTKVNGVPIVEIALKDGDEIHLGGFPLRVRVSEDERVSLVDAKPLDTGMGTYIVNVGDIAKAYGAEDTGEGDLVRGAAVPTVPPTHDIQKSYNALKFLTKVVESIIKVQPLDQVLDTIMDMVFSNFAAERGFLMLHDRDYDTLVPKVVRFKKAGLQEEKIAISRTITNKVFREKQAILTQDAQIDSQFEAGESIRFLGIRSAMCVPLWHKEDVIGIIYADSLIQSKSFSEADLELLAIMANYAAVGIEHARLNARIQEEMKKRAKLERYHSPGVISRILDSPESGGELVFDLQEREATVLFTDIVGFTSMAEKLEPHKVAYILNDYFSQMTDIIFQNEGTLDKYIGDAIMAVFGAPFPQEDHASRAVRAALQMRQVLESINQKRGDGLAIQIRTGINSGKVVAGDVGSPKRMEYTVLGDTVNVASRLESAVAEPGQIIVGENTYELIKGRFKVRPIGTPSMQGITKAMLAYEVLDTP
ncbi:MAG: adenylate/guanylate cyclase domain-containing protein [Acidobacteriota bacterium]